MKKFHLLSLLPLATASLAPAASITYFGSIEDTTVNEWRTPSTAKPTDIDGDNLYGTHAAVQWTVGSSNEGSPTAGWAYGGDSGQFNNVAFAQIDNINNPSTDTGAGIAALGNPGTFTFGMTGILTTYADRILRIGVMADILTSSEWAADTNKTITLTQIVGGISTATVSLRNGAAGNGQPELYFFDLTGVNPGDQFRFDAANTGSSGQAGYIGPVT